MSEASSMDRVIERRSKRPLVYGVVGSLAVVLAGYAIYTSLDARTSFTLSGQRIKIAEVRRGVFEDYIPLRASVEPEKTVYLDAVEGGRVEQVLVEEGAYVEKGTALVELSNTGLQLDVIAREAEVSEQLNNLRNTQLAIEQNRLKLKGDLIEIDFQIRKLLRLVERHEKLKESQFLSRQEYENSKDELLYYRQRREVTRESQEQDERIRIAQIQQLESSAARLEENLGIARANLDNLTIRAPRAGHLTSLNAEIGESKARGERLGQIDDVDRFKATALVSEFYINRVRNGQIAQLTLDGRNFELLVSKIHPEVQNAQFEVDLQFSGEAPTGIRRGQTLQMRLVLGDLEEQATLLENGPFFNDTGGAWVFVLDEDQQVAERRRVRFGRRNPNYIEVESGLLPGDHVIVSSYGSFIDVERLYVDG